MTEIGKWNTLEVVKELDFGIYLNGGEEGEILMPTRYVPEGTKIGDKINVFIYLDSEDRLIATTEIPLAIVGEIALLEAVAVNAAGAFLNWGLPKDLLVPYREQRQQMEVGEKYVVYIYVDEKSGRIAATAKIEDFLDKTPHTFEEKQEVDLVLYEQTELGFKAIINGTHTGIVYHGDVFRVLKRGEKTKGYIKKIREDRKIDLILDKPGYEKVDTVSQQILEKLKEQKGFIPLVDKSPADDIYETFGISKKTFKKAIGSLYKARLITIEENGIKLVNT